MLEVMLSPDDGAVLLVEGHQGATDRADGEDDRVLVDERAGPVPALPDISLQSADQIVLPDDRAGVLLQRMQPAGGADGVEEIADDRRRRDRAWSLLQVIFLHEIGLA